MKMQDAIDRAKRLRDTEIPDEDMVSWLSTHDEQLFDRVLTHYGIEKPENLPYSRFLEEHADDHYTAEDVELMIPDKYGLELYPLYLVMQIDLHHGDIDRYNNDALMYNAIDLKMRQDYSRERKWRPPRAYEWPNDICLQF